MVKYGGSLSGEHGDGQAKAEFLPIMYGPELMQAFREFKAIWDPQNRMNPGKLIDPRPADEDLRLGPHYRPVTLATNFSFRQRGRQRLHPRHRALHRHGQVPLARAAARCARATAHAGGALLDARPRAAARRDAARRGDHRRLAERGREGGARQCLALQGLPQRVPDAHRHGGLQGRVPVALLRGDIAGRVRRGRWGASASGRRSHRVYLGLANRLSGLGISTWMRRPPNDPCRGSRRRRSALTFTTAARGRASASCCSTTRSTTTSARRPRARRRSARSRGLRGGAAARSTCAAAGRTTTTACWTARSARSTACSTCSAQLEGLPVVVLEPGCLSVFRDELTQLLPEDARRAAAAGLLAVESAVAEECPRGETRQRQVLCTPIAIKRRCGEPRPTSSC